MTDLLDHAPYGPRDDARFLQEMNSLTEHHRTWCAPFARIWPDWSGSDRVETIPFVHVGLFKREDLATEFPGAKRGRTLRSSGSGGAVSRIALDEESSGLQARSAAAILENVLGAEKRPLLVIDRAQSLRELGVVSARLAAALSLAPLASEIEFLLDPSPGSDRIRWDVVARMLARHSDLLVYGFTSILWLEWAKGEIPAAMRSELSRARIAFVHSGGWKRLEASGVDAPTLERGLLDTTGSGSSVVDFYGLVEQVGLLFPLCRDGFRHVPVWADVLVRDAATLESVEGRPGLLQLVNVLARGAPCHSVLTEDLGRIVAGPCPCGRSGKRFELLGRIPKAELRGCANV